MDHANDPANDQANDQAKHQPKDKIGRFEILRRLGEGGMGEVFLARDPLLDREVAVKTILSDRAVASDSQERFLREAKTAGALSHPNLVTVHEFGVDAGIRFIVMEYLPGQDLRAFLSLRSLTPWEVLEVLAQVCDGLAHAHARKVLHRDIKPSNVRVWREDGKIRAKVMDFGLARLPDSDLTATGAIMGTFAYMAPESLSSGKSDERSDTYAVGVILFEALKGVRPTLAVTLPEMAKAGAPQIPFALPADALKGISSRTWEIVMKAMAGDPAQRFQTASELALALRGAQDPGWPGLSPEPIRYDRLRNLYSPRPQPHRMSSREVKTILLQVDDRAPGLSLG